MRHVRLEIHHMGAGVLVTASPHALAQTMEVAQSHPSMAAGTQDNHLGGFRPAAHARVTIST